MTFCRAGVKLPTVTVCFKDLTVSTTVYVGNRALPSTVNAYRNLFEDFLIRLGIMRGNKQPFTILDNISGTLKPVWTLIPGWESVVPLHSVAHNHSRPLRATLACCWLNSRF